jgi:hypothetical protein
MRFISQSPEKINETPDGTSGRLRDVFSDIEGWYQRACNRRPSPICRLDRDAGSSIMTPRRFGDGWFGNW